MIRASDHNNEAACLLGTSSPPQLPQESSGLRSSTPTTPQSTPTNSSHHDVFSEQSQYSTPITRPNTSLIPRSIWTNLDVVPSFSIANSTYFTNDVFPPVASASFEPCSTSTAMMQGARPKEVANNKAVNGLGSFLPSALLEDHSSWAFPSALAPQITSPARQQNTLGVQVADIDGLYGLENFRKLALNAPLDTSSCIRQIPENSPAVSLKISSPFDSSPESKTGVSLNPPPIGFNSSPNLAHNKFHSEWMERHLSENRRVNTDIHWPGTKVSPVRRDDGLLSAMNELEVFVSRNISTVHNGTSTNFPALLSPISHHSPPSQIEQPLGSDSLDHVPSRQLSLAPVPAQGFTSFTHQDYSNKSRYSLAAEQHSRVNSQALSTAMTTRMRQPSMGTPMLQEYQKRQTPSTSSYARQSYTDRSRSYSQAFDKRQPSALRPNDDSRFTTNYCSSHPYFKKRVYCRTHRQAICGHCAGVFGFHSNCDLQPKLKDHFPGFLNLVKELKGLANPVIRMFKRASVKNFLIPVDDVMLFNLQFTGNDNLQNSEELSSLLVALNLALTYVAEGNRPFQQVCEKVSHCEMLMFYNTEVREHMQSFSMQRVLEDQELPANVLMVGQGATQTICNFKSKFYLQCLSLRGKPCSDPTPKMTARGFCQDGSVLPVALQKYHLPGVVEATFTSYIPGGIALQVMIDDVVVAGAHASVAKMNKYTRMEVKGYFLTGAMLNKPWGICVSSEGEIYVADRCNNNIKVFNATFEFRRCISEYGQEEGQVRKPAGIALDKRQDIVVCDKDNHRIQVFKQDGTFVRSSRNFTERFEYPYTVAVNSYNQYIVSHSKFKISIMTDQFQQVKLFFPDAPTVSSYVSPRGICVGPLDEIFFTDFDSTMIMSGNSQAMSFTSAFNTTSTYSRTSSRRFEDNQSDPPRRLQNLLMDNDGNFVITDSKQCEVLFRNFAGKNLGQVSNLIGKPMSVAPMPGLQDFYVVVLDDDLGVAVIGPHGIDLPLFNTW